MATSIEQPAPETLEAGRAPATTRGMALGLIASAARVFIVYSSADMAQVRDLRRRIQRVRKGHSGDSVFMAAESLPVGHDVSPEDVRAALERADLVIVACGEHTPRSPFVIEEVRQAIAQRTAGKSEILPVILKSGVRLPDGVDFSIQAIHRAILFPAIRWVPIAAVAVIALAILGAAYFWRDGQATYIRESLRYDDLATHSPLDLGREQRLRELRQTAGRLWLRESARALDAKLATAGRPSMRRVLLPPDPSRKTLVADPTNPAIWVGYESRIEALDPESLAPLRIFDLGKLEVAPFSRRSAVSGSDAVPRAEPAARQPAKLLGLRTDPRVPSILAEVEYDGFAAGDDQGLGPDVLGDEVEVLHLAMDRPFPELVAKRVSLVVKTLRGAGDADPSLPFAEPMRHDAEVEEALSRLGTVDEAAVRRTLDENEDLDRTDLLALDPASGAMLAEVRTRTERRHEDDDWEDKASLRDYVVGLLKPGAGFEAVVPTTQYYAKTGDLSTDDNLQWGYTDVVPIYRPAAVEGGLGRAWVRDKPVELVPGGRGDAIQEFGPDHPPQPAAAVWRIAELRDVRWSKTGGWLRLTFADGSIGRSAPDGESGLHRFLLPENARGIDIDPSGRSVWVLLADGEVDAWDLEAFGADGWVGTSTDPR